ncbi:MAG TPA: hypothetical protein VMZ90_01595, partial [Vicinamibacterales bacterium]|nr:hypothetical protein [Vicinamibacterales bacterium]
MKRTSLALVASVVLGSCGGAHVSTAPPPPPHVAAPSPLALLQDDLTSIFGGPQFERSFWSVLVRPAAANANPRETLFALNPGKLVMPGSNMKLLTLAAASE